MNTITVLKDDIKMKFKETGREGLKLIDLVQDRYKRPAVVNRMMNIRVPYNEKNLLSNRGTIRCSRRPVVRGAIHLVSQSVSQSVIWSVSEYDV